jgi:hypothetical protein
MKRYLFFIPLVFLSGAVLAACTHNDEPEAIPQENAAQVEVLTAPIANRQTGGASGQAALTRADTDRITASLQFDGNFTAEQPVEAKIMEGSCDAPGDEVVTLGEIRGTRQEFSIGMSMEDLVGRSPDLIVAVPNPQDEGQFLSCGQFAQAAAADAGLESPAPDASPTTVPGISPTPLVTPATTPGATANPDTVLNPAITPHPPADTGGYF